MPGVDSQSLVMVEHTDQRRSAVRGLISRTRLARQLGTEDLTGQPT